MPLLSSFVKLVTKVRLVHIATEGDQNSQPLAEVGGMGLFTKAIQLALLDNRIDLAVHSLKDLPTEPVKGLALAAVPVREQVNDVLVTATGCSLDELRPAAIVGTGSIRRRAQLLHVRPDLKVIGIRGNVGTRIEKLSGADLDAIVLAAAGLRRLGKLDAGCWTIPTGIMLPAVGQGALGIEIRSDDERTANCVCVLDHVFDKLAVQAERSLLFALTAGCLAPVGAWAQVDNDKLELTAAVFSSDGREKISATMKSEVQFTLPSAADSTSSAIDLGRDVAKQLLSQGAAALIADAK